MDDLIQHMPHEFKLRVLGVVEQHWEAKRTDKRGGEGKRRGSLHGPASTGAGVGEDGGGNGIPDQQNRWAGSVWTHEALA